MSRRGISLMIAVAAVAVSAVVLPATASAMRIASPPEAAQMDQALGTSSSTCTMYKISTLDPNWAAAVNCFGNADSWDLLEWWGTRWQMVISGNSDSACPLAQANVDVIADLGICPPVSKLPYYAFFPISQPSDLFLGIKPSSMATMIRAYGVYRNIRWSSWGQSQALGRGVLYYQFQGVKKRIPFRIRLYRAVTCENGLRIFTKRKMRAVRRGMTRWFSSDARITRIGSCEKNQDTEIF